MLVEFSVTNFRSFNQKQTLSMESQGKDGFFYETGFKKARYLTHIAGFYGANGSGKSNVFNALKECSEFITFGFGFNKPNQKLKHDYFCLSADTKNAPTEFYVKFIQNDRLYEYEFHYNAQRILFEKLTYFKKDDDETQRKNLVLERIYNPHIQSYEYNENLNDAWYSKTRHNVLALTMASYFDDAEAEKVYIWFDDLLNISDNNKFHKMNTFTKLLTHQQQIQSLMQKADIGIVDYEIVNIPLELSPKEIWSEIESGNVSEEDIIFTHQSSDSNHNKIEFDEQSNGTKIFFGLSGILLEVLEKGKILCIDEIDANMHPDLLMHIIHLFQNPKINTKNAQLIFSAHNTYLMNHLTQEQIWVTQKDKTGATEIYSLLDYKIKKTDDFIAHYHKGVFGGVPYITGLIDEKE